MKIHPYAIFLCLLPALAATTAATTPPVPSYPELTYSTYLRDSFTPNAIAMDAAGNIYLAGSAAVDPSTMQITALIVKLNPQATQYLYVRYFGGSVHDSAAAIAVDSAGNAYIAGTTSSPDFPVTPGGNLGTAAAGATNQRSFVAKFDPNGNLIFSDLLGGATASGASALAVNASGEILVSGVAQASGFPTTAGAYSISDSNNHPFLLELDPTGTKLVFSATGIGGSALALDSAGNIYIAGSTYLLDYPTTPGAYQTEFPMFEDCVAPCFMSASQGENQYVTKVDPTATMLIFSTSVSGTDNTTNGGLAVDSAGDVYLTGFAAATYPYTIPPPALPPAVPDLGPLPALPFLTKLDPTGSKLLFSVPVGGAGVQLDSSGNVYVGGMIGDLPGPTYGYSVPGTLPALPSLPAQCQPNTSVQKSSYASEVDAATGNVRGTQFIGGSTLTISGVALTGSTLWLAGATGLPDFPFSPGALTIPYFQPGPVGGAYLGAVDFSQPQPPAGTPQIACIVDAADYALAGTIAPDQVLTIFGTNLGPSKPVTATNYTTGVLGGVDVSFDSAPSPLLYVSSTQINFAVPVFDASPYTVDMRVTVNGVSSPTRQFPLTYQNLSLYLAASPPASNVSGFPPQVLALNADGSLNSATNPAPLGSVISVFLNGASSNSAPYSITLPLSSNLGWTVTNIAPANPFVMQVSLQVPSKLEDDFACNSTLTVCDAEFQLFDVGGDSAGPASGPTSGVEVAGTVYVSQTQ
jgi:uncharacterized protein (TIGR03437 family)